ncbi:MAG: OmpH family outer membrane protein [Lentisphaeria bacterium]|nr:OmpH family outer membrane protein [Lentisphaeria bacterium]NQZ67881.1 OmpH family outer membrane protein [Lentisphaeria bacterium]
MKKGILLFTALLLNIHAADEIVACNLNKVLHSWWKKEEAFVRISTEALKYKQRAGVLKGKLAATVKEFQESLIKSQNQVLSEKVRAEASIKAKELRENYKNQDAANKKFTQSAKQQMNRIQSAEMGKLLIEIRQIVTGEAEKKGYTIVLDSSDSSMRPTSVLFVKSHLDITEDIIKLLKASAPKKPEEKKPAEKKPAEKKPEAKKPEAKKPEAKKPEAKKPEDKKPAAKK